MTCDKYMEMLSARLDGALTEAEEGDLEAHLAVCPDCRAVGAQLAALRGAFDELEGVEAPEGFAQGVMERIRAEEKPKVIPLFKRPQFRVLAGLAACLVLAVGLYGASRPRHWDETVKIDMAVRSFNRDALIEEADGIALGSAEADVPMVSAYAASEPADNSAGTAGMEKSAPDAVENGPGDRPLMEGTTSLERMPEGAAELIPPETAVMSTDDRRGSIYLDLPLEVLEQIERLAQEQGIGITAERCSNPEAEVRYNLEILQQDH